ncbi:hypothetical protein HPB52_010284 [Rhipicephalus sanguineus]|uniref:Endonuclease/exonuclease/phosphatase domain-containing protein n=1 Tax=Rhipicephalus sanguineus TaxID=34632 RepID=A0A9D4PR79_RHISA|nr:hypothetical protein HPB52_010284 [Rhipicephalus sanguineus]
MQFIYIAVAEPWSRLKRRRMDALQETPTSSRAQPLVQPDEESGIETTEMDVQVLSPQDSSGEVDSAAVAERQDGQTWTEDGWQTVLRRRQEKSQAKKLKNAAEAADCNTSSNSQPKQGSQEKRGRRPRRRRPLPPLPKEDIKIVLRPHKGLAVKDLLGCELSTAVIDACHRHFDGSSFILRVHPGSNIIILSMPHEHGVKIEGARMLGSTKTAIITFTGSTLPRCVYFMGAEAVCYPHKPTKQACKVCHSAGHRTDVCPTPDANEVTSGSAKTETPSGLVQLRPGLVSGITLAIKILVAGFLKREDGGSRLPANQHGELGDDCVSICSLNRGSGHKQVALENEKLRRQIKEERREFQKIISSLETKLEGLNALEANNKPTHATSKALVAHSPERETATVDTPQTFSEEARAARAVGTRDQLVVVGDFNAPSTVWGYVRDSPKGVLLEHITFKLGFNLITLPTSPIRLGDSISRDTYPDLTFTLNIKKATWSNLDENVGSDHYILSTSIASPKLRRVVGDVVMTDWVTFRKRPLPEQMPSDVSGWALVMSRVTYGLPYHLLDRIEESQVDALIRSAFKAALGLPMSTPTQRFPALEESPK